MSSKFIQTATYSKKNETTNDVVAIHQMKSATTGMVIYNVCFFEDDGNKQIQTVNELWGDNNEAMDKFTTIADEHDCTVEIDQ